MLVSFSTASRPSALAIQKHSAAPTMELVHDRMAPCHQPKRLALAMVMRNAGSGAAMDWKTISRNDTTAA